ncbi:mechanosensitive ion channel family protein [Candidatus Gracilibacteria bacterium]|nr:mechanosensitive ion channel family protein [Candidatus Gracilibacteria bacterium]MCF7856126.1 mechanosensitive ion channel family protein [Candidatus Gracilibacteria bacterium]MCF7896545.1 mechanosensitive ion channel family protein [Candidatus Gracilibacteria bacterium]
MELLQKIQPFLTKLQTFSWWGIDATKWGIALLIFLVLILGYRFFKYHILKNLKKLAKKTETDLDDTLVEVLEEIPNYFYWLVSAFIAFHFLGTTNEFALKIVNGVFVVFLVFRLIAIIQKFINYTIAKVWLKDEKLAEEKQTAIHGIKIIATILLWSIGFLLVLSNLGIEVSTLVASLGIGGVAIAFALQNILGDLFSSFAIYFDKPFQIGDYIVLGTDSGTVKKIGLKTTRITTLQGEELVVSNTELTSTRIKNFKRMKKRRIVFGFGVVYGTATTKLRKIPDLISKIIIKEEMAEIERVHFKEFGDFSLNFEVVYYVKNREYIDYMNTQQFINFAIKEAFEKEKIEMAFPTQTIYVQK